MRRKCGSSPLKNKKITTTCLGPFIPVYAYILFIYNITALTQDISQIDNQHIIVE